MTTLSLYLPGHSALHRLTPGLKLAGLLVAETAVLVGVRNPLVALLAVLAATALFAVARVPARTVWRQLRTALVLALIVGVAQSFHLGAPQATVVAAQLLVCVALAVLVTLTTRTTDLLDVVEAWCRPLRRIKVDPTRVALVLALAIRCIPLVAALADEVRDAHRARGARLSIVGLAVPLTIRTLRHAEQLGDALIARGVDD